MNRLGCTGDERIFLADPIGFSNFDISWAGLAHPWREGFCFGSDDGRIKFTNSDISDGTHPILVAESMEAVNGVAFWGDMMAVSTRSEVVYRHQKDSLSGWYEHGAFAGGAHGLIVTSKGNFIAPLGIDGLLVKAAKAFEPFATRRIRPRGETFNIYKVVSLDSIDGPGRELLTCAARRDGLAIVIAELNGSGGSPRMFRAPDTDIVDVGKMGTAEAPRAVAAIDKDRSLHFVRDVLDVRSPQTLHFDGLLGTAFRILSAEGHLFLLTSESLYAFPNLASRFLSEGRPDGYTTAWAVPLQAVDIYPAGSRLMVVMPDHVMSIRVKDFVPVADGDASRFRTHVDAVPWEDCSPLSLDYAMI